MNIVTKEFEIQGCVEVPASLSEDEFNDKFIKFIESNNWSFGGLTREYNPSPKYMFLGSDDDILEELHTEPSEKARTGVKKLLSMFDKQPR